MALSAVALLIICLTTSTTSDVLQCIYPDPPDHGKVFLVGDKPIVGSVVAYTCDGNRRLVGSSSNFCHDEGKWVVPKPRCVEFPFELVSTSTLVQSLTSTTTQGIPTLPPVNPLPPLPRIHTLPPIPTTRSSTPESSFTSTTFRRFPTLSPLPPLPRIHTLPPIRFTISTPVGSTISTPVVSNSSCTCTYMNGDNNLKAYVNEKTLRNRDYVKDGYNVRFQCIGYYRLSGPSNITCRQCRTWTYSEYPKCVPSTDVLQCKYPDPPEHGKVHLVGDRPIVGSVVAYTCDGNRRLVGSTAAVCLDDGKWIVPKPRCVEFPFDVTTTSTPVPSLTSTAIRWFPTLPPLPTKPSIRSSTSTPSLRPSSITARSPISTAVTSTISTTTVSTVEKPFLDPVLSNSNCTCTYINSDPNLVAYANMQRLQNRDPVKDGYNVKFHCSPLGYYHLSGPSNITCRYCRTWFSSEYPKCVLPKMGDAIIRTKETDNAIEFPGGYIGVPQGSLLRMICLSYHESNALLSRPLIPQLVHHQYRPKINVPSDQPRWTAVYSGPKTYPTYINIYNQVVYEHGTRIRTQVLELHNASREHTNVYKCVVQSGKNMSVEIQVLMPDATCPKFNQNGDFTLQYSKEQSVNSNAVFSCKNLKERIVGYSNLTCMSNGHWSADPPQCMKMCPKIKETEGMRIHYSNLQDTDSTANFHCQVPRVLNGQSYTRCKSDGHWADPIPTCEMPLCHLSALYGELPGNAVIITGDTQNDTVPYSFSLRLNCASNGRLGELSKTVTCGLYGKWEIEDTSKLESQWIFTGPEIPKYDVRTLTPSSDGSLKSTSYGESLETPIRIWYDTCLRRSERLRGSYPINVWPRSTTK